jgi:hypothetical protein
MANAARIALSLFTEKQLTSDNFGDDRATEPLYTNTEYMLNTSGLE